MQIGSAISAVPHLAAFVQVAQDQFFDIDLSGLLLYIIDTAPADTLPYLAEQFDVLGYKGWLFADTEEKKRALLKKAIQLHRKKGTPWSIKEAIKAIGYNGAQVVEGVGVTYDGTIDFDGTQDYGGGSGIFNFGVRVFVSEGYVWTSEDTDRVTNLVNAYKREACNLIFVEHAELTEDGEPF